MVRDVAETKRRIKEAAIVEFASHGLHGTTMERIAAVAGVNKERIYAYFVDKPTLFDAVIDAELRDLVAVAPLSIDRAEDVGDYAGRVFDYHQRHPDLVRLMLWSGLAARDPGSGQTGHDDLYLAKAAVFRKAQDRGAITDRFPAGHLAFLIMGVVDWWSAMPHAAHSLAASQSPDDEQRLRRASVVEAAIRLARPSAIPD